MIELSNRLRLIADKIPVSDVVCDIGTDHAYVPIYLIKKRICKKAIASDVRIGPIKKAEANIKKYDLNNYIELRLGNGLETVIAGECDTIIIAGMGGVLITEIISNSIDIARAADTIIIQCMYANEVLREWLLDNDFYIEDEELTAEQDKIYNVMVVRYDAGASNRSKNNYVNKDTEKDIAIDIDNYLLHLYIGKRLFEKNDPLLKDLLEKRLNQYGKILKGISMAKQIDLGEKKKYEYLVAKIKEKLKLIQ